MAKKSAGTGKRKVHKVMKEYKEGSLKSSSGSKVGSRKQAVAIALSEARSAGPRSPIEVDIEVEIEIVDRLSRRSELWFAKNLCRAIRDSEPVEIEV